ncbi:MAG: YraN family protein [Chloroflexi bacterium]|nr:YraN family protein [Chloroflexota bacterium]
MRTRAQATGDAAEAAAAAYLTGIGWQVFATHVRVGHAELDIVAVDPGPVPALVIVEVRWRGRRDYGLPEETVDRRKRARLHEAGIALRDRGRFGGGTPLPNLPLRFDLIAVEPGGRLRHYRHGA